MIIYHSVILMFVGMGVVLSFLVLLVFVLKGAALVVPKLSYMMPDPEPAAPRKKNGASDDEAVAVAIAAAAFRAGGNR